MSEEGYPRISPSSHHIQVTDKLYQLLVPTSHSSSGRKTSHLAAAAGGETAATAAGGEAGGAAAGGGGDPAGEAPEAEEDFAGGR